MKRLMAAAAIAASCAGCFTLHESEYPRTENASAGGKDIKVQLSGFEASVTTYTTVYGYETVYTHGGYHRYRRGGGYWWPTTVATETYVPHTTQTSAFLDRATEILEVGGFNVKCEKPDYRVEVKFSGPVVTDNDRAVMAAWSLLSVLSADYGVQAWSAKLKIYEVATGKLLLMHDYDERYQAVVWGPIPIFSPSGSSKTSDNTMQNWCLMALTDKAMADATAFLATTAK